MSAHPANLALRFVLELAAWASIGYWGWAAQRGAWRFVLAFGLPLMAMVVWGTFRVPDDPGAAPVAVPGIARLIIELVEFGAAVALLFAAGRPALAVALGALVLLHYALSYDRVVWLLTQR